MPSHRLQIAPEPVTHGRPVNRSVADMFIGLDTFEQRALIDRLALLPSDIQQLIADGVIANDVLCEARIPVAGG